jgi:hypothetical protein
MGLYHKGQMWFQVGLSLGSTKHLQKLPNSPPPISRNFPI